MRESIKIKWPRNVNLTGESINAFKTLGWKPEYRPPETTGKVLSVMLKNLKEIRCQVVDCIQLAWDTTHCQWRVLKHGNNLSDTLKTEEFLDQLSDCLLKKEPTQYD
jgi:hypothetical protein